MSYKQLRRPANADVSDEELDERDLLSQQRREEQNEIIKETIRTYGVPQDSDCSSSVDRSSDSDCRGGEGSKALEGWDHSDFIRLQEDLKKWREQIEERKRLLEPSSPRRSSFSEITDLDDTENIERDFVRNIEETPKRFTKLSPNIRLSSSCNESPPGKGSGDSSKDNKMSARVPNALCPPAFRGDNTDKEEANVWLRKYKIYVDLVGWTPVMARKSFPLFLAGGAADWYDGLKEVDKSLFSSLEQAFKDRYFPHPAMRWTKLEEFNSRTQKKDEDVDQYCQLMTKKGKELNKSDQEIMEACIRGLRDLVREFVMERSPSSLSEMLNHARTAQAIRKAPGSGKDTAEIAALSTQLREVQDSMKEQIASLRDGVAEIAVLSRQNAGTIAAIHVPQDTGGSYTGAQYGQYYPQEGQGQIYYASAQGFYPQPQSASSQNTQAPLQAPPQAPQQRTPAYTDRTIQCYACSEFGHLKRNCRFKDAKCLKCGRLGHIQRACRPPQRRP